MQGYSAVMRHGLRHLTDLESLGGVSFVTFGGAAFPNVLDAADGGSALDFEAERQTPRCPRSRGGSRFHLHALLATGRIRPM